MTTVSVCIPYAPYHAERVGNAIQSIHHADAILTFADEHQRGAGYARNVLLARAQTDYVIFLDADDTLASDFIPQTIAAIQAQSYVYTDWWQETDYRAAPAPRDVWTNHTYHLVTTLIRRTDALAIGGFDESLIGAEDTDFYLRLRLSGVCGVHVPQALLWYNRGGQRSIKLHQSGQLESIKQWMVDRYGERQLLMACCGDSTPNPQIEANQPFEGAVLAQAIYPGNRRVQGLASGILYPRTGNGKVLYVDQRDIAKMPNHFKAVSSEPEPLKPLANLGLQDMNAQQIVRLLVPGLADAPEYHVQATPIASQDRSQAVKTAANRAKRRVS